MSKYLLPCLVSLASLSIAQAQNSPGVSIDDFVLGHDDANAPSAKLQYGAAGEMDFDDIDDSFSHSRLLLETPLGGLIPINDCNALSIGLRYEASWLETDTFLGDQSLHDARVNFTWMHHQAGSQWSFLASLSPGLSSDLDGVDGDDFSVNGKVGFRYEFNDRFALIAGMGIDNTTGDRSLFPAVGFQWRPLDDVHLALLGATFTATWQPHSDWLVRCGVWPGGGVWNVEHHGDSFDVSLRSYRAAVGVERRLGEKVWLSVWAGTTLANSLEIETDSGGDIFDEDAEASWFFNVGLRVAAW